MRALLLTILIGSATACASELDTTGLPSVDDYGTWGYFDVHGFIPGHGDSWRAIFFNHEARNFLGVSRYPEGSAMVKEVRTLRHDPDAAGGLQYIAIMRKVAEPPDGVVTDGGWVFSYKDSPDGAEHPGDTCYATCHRQAPFDGAFFDYGTVGTDP